MKTRTYNFARFLLLFMMCIGLSTVYAQKWGRYTLVATQNTTAKLVDTSNVVYKTWTLTGNTGYSAYMLEGGVLLRSVTTTNSVFSGGGMHGRVQKIDWSGNIIWDYTYSTTTYCGHHDIQPLPNGNVLMIVYELKSAAETSAAGCSTSKVLWPDKIIEIQPTGTTTGTIVWEWHVWDHLVQNVTSTKSNYQTSIIDHPELININYNNSTTTKDWMHSNGLDYNAELDQITFSSHNLNEVYVIDHSTTTAEAASHTGGNSGKGGDILYRWGNPAAYGATGTANFNVVHDAHWIPAGCPRAGSLVGFNNGATTSYSGADIFYPPYSGYNYSRTTGAAYLPTVYDKRILMNGKTTNQGNSQQLPNGNTIYAIALSGNLYEVDSNGTQVWSYSAGSQLAQTFRYSNCHINGPTAVTAGTSATAVCAGSSVALSSSATGISAISYAWTSDVGGFTSALQNPTVSPTATTVYTLTATSNGCSTSKTITVTINPKPTTGIITGLSTVIPAAVETYSVPITSGSAYNWIVSGGTVSSGANTNSVNITWGATIGSGSVKVVETNASGCKGDTVSLSVARLGSINLVAAPSSLSYTNTTGSQKIYITANTSWTVSSNAIWAVPAKTSGTGNDSIAVAVSANGTILNRAASITITAGTIVQTVTITQDSSALVFSVTPATVSFTKNTGSQKVVITGNSTWAVSSNQAWMVPVKTTGSGTDSFMVTVTANTDTISRAGTLTFTSGAITHTVTAVQDSTPVYINTSPASISFSNTASSGKVYVNSSVAWTVTADQTWVTLGKTSGTGNDSITLTVTANGTTSARTASLSFKGGSAAYTLPVTQNSTASFLTVTPSTHTGINTGQTLGASISSNVSWTVSCNETWVTLLKTVGSGNDSLYFTLAANGTINKRTGTINVTTGSITQTLTLTQDSTPAYLTVNKSTVTFTQPTNADTVIVSSNTNWTASSSQTWLTLHKTSGSGNDSLKLTATANTTFALRSAIVTVAVGSLIKTITVTQTGLAIPDTLIVSTTQVHAVNTAASYPVSVTANVVWTVNNTTSWFTVTPAGGVTSATLSIAVAANTTNSSRTATFTVTSGSLIRTITVLQDSTPVADQLTVNVDTIHALAAGGSTSVLVTSNRAWTVSSNQSWATLDKTGSSGAGTFNVTSAVNTGAARNAAITVTAGTMVKTVFVSQAAPTTGLADVTGGNEVNVYPNPTSGMVYINQTETSNNYKVVVTDAFGKMIQTMSNQQNIDLSEYANGVYYIQVQTENTQSAAKKIILIK